MESSAITPTATKFLEFSRNKLLEQYWPRLRTCVESLSEDQLWWRPNPSSNSIGNLVLHLNGNVRQWLVASFNRIPDERNRPSEFNRKDGLAAAQLVALLAETLREAEKVLGRLSEADLQEGFVIQGYHVTGLEAVYQVVEHFGVHFGQIAYITKMLRNASLDFYRELDATGKAS